MGGQMKKAASVVLLSLFVALLQKKGAVEAAALDRMTRDVCPKGTSWYFNQDRDRGVCCHNITCSIGEEPVVCDDLVSHDPSCRPCPEGTFMNMRLSLRDKSRNKCRMKTRCNFYKDKGSRFKDATCYCPPHRWDSGDGICPPRHLCPPGYGQGGPQGTCLRCKEGKTYSDIESDSEQCKPVRNCTKEGRCYVKQSTTKSDSVCGPVSYDLRKCNENPTTTVKPMKTTRTDAPIKVTPTEGPSSTPDKADLIGGLCGGLLFLSLLLVLIVVGVKKAKGRRKRKHQVVSLETKHRNIAKAIEKAADRDNVLNEVYQITEDYLVEEEFAKWKRLGSILLERKYAEFEMMMEEKDILPSDRMWELLQEWKERCRTKGPDMEHLFHVMYSPKYELNCRSLVPDIERKFGNTLGAIDDSLLSPNTLGAIDDSLLSLNVFVVRCFCPDKENVTAENELRHPLASYHVGELPDHVDEDDRPDHVGDQPNHVGDQPNHVGDQPNHVGDQPSHVGDDSSRPQNDLQDGAKGTQEAVDDDTQPAVLCKQAEDSDNQP